jgi:hypothetical protein
MNEYPNSLNTSYEQHFLPDFLPDFSEMLAGFFGGGSSAKKSKAKALKRR